MQIMGDNMKRKTLTYLWQVIAIIVTVLAVILISSFEAAWFNTLFKGSADVKKYSSDELAKMLSENIEDFDKAYDAIFSESKLLDNFNYERSIFAYSLSGQLRHHELQRNDRKALKHLFSEYGMRSISIRGDMNEPLLICISFDTANGNSIKVIRIVESKEQTCMDYYAEISDDYKYTQYGNWYLLTSNAGGGA